MRLSLIAPTYLCEEGLIRFVSWLDLLAKSQKGQLQVVIVDDASPDQTGSVLVDLATGRPWLDPVVLHRRTGQNGAILAGLPFCTGRFLGIIDGDGDYDPRCFVGMLNKIDDADLVNGSRMPESAPGFRSIATAVVRGSMNIASTGDPLSDPTSPVKLVRMDIAKRALQHPLSETHFHEALVLVSKRNKEISITRTGKGPPSRYSFSTLAGLWTSLVVGCVRHHVNERRL